MTYTGFRFTGKGATTTRPAARSQAVSGNTWARDATSPTADDGTEIDQTWANRVKAALEALSALGGTANQGDDQLAASVVAYVAAELAEALADYATAAAVSAALAAKAPLASPNFSGAATAPTVPGTIDSSTKIATTAFVQAVAETIGGAPVDSVAGLIGAISASDLKTALAIAAGDVSGLGSAAAKNVGTSAGNVVELNGSAQLPAVSGALLTGLPVPAGAAKAWALINADGTIAGSSGVASVTKNATGDYTVTFSAALANANFAVAGVVDGVPTHCLTITSRTTTTVRLVIFDGAYTAAADKKFSIVVFGA